MDAADGKRTEDGRRRAEGRRRRAEGRRRKTEDRRQKTEGGGLRAEGGIMTGRLGEFERKVTKEMKGMVAKTCKRLRLDRINRIYGIITIGTGHLFAALRVVCCANLPAFGDDARIVRV